MAPVNRCDECQRTMPNFDNHRNCARCRPCATRDRPHCATCKDWGDRLWGLQGKWLALHEPALARALGLTPGASPGKTLVSGSNKTKSVCKPAARAGVQLTHTEEEVNDTPAGSQENSSAESAVALSLGTMLPPCLRTGSRRGSASFVMKLLSRQLRAPRSVWLTVPRWARVPPPRSAIPG